MLISKYISKIALPALCLALMGMSSCSDMLDLKPQGVFSEEQLDDDSIEGIMAAAYEGLEAHFWADNNNPAFAGPSTNWIFDVRSDDAYKGGGAISMEANIHQLEISNILSDNASCFNKWENTFYAVARCNKAILAVQSAGLENQDVLVAELKALRAYFYFDLIRVFKAIPYFTEVDDPNKASAHEFSREQIFQFIKKDLEDAINVLPSKQDKPGRINRFAAAAIHAKVSAFTSSWDEVLKYSNIVMEGPYQLYPNFLDMSKVEFNNTYESIFAIQFSTANDRFHLNWCNLLNTTYSEGNLYGYGDDFFLASQNLVNAFRTDNNGLPILDGSFNDVKVTVDYDGNVDPRLDFTVGRIGMPFRGHLYTSAWCRAYDLYGEYSGKKGLCEPGAHERMNEMPWGGAPLNFCLIRYADIVLLKAEALIELNSSLDEARELINSVRRKAARSIDPNYAPVDINPNLVSYLVKEYPAEGWTQEYARKAVRMERRLELAMEGHRWFDLVRWGVAVDVMNKYMKEEAKIRPYYEGASVSEDELFFPIPLVEQENGGDLYK